MCGIRGIVLADITGGYLSGQRTGTEGVKIPATYLPEPAQYAACLWAAAQLDYDESEEAWFAVYGTTPIQLEV